MLALLGVFSAQPCAFSQEVDQQTTTRRIKAKFDPKYPELARQYHLAGKVRIEVTVSPNGSVKKASVVGGNPLLAGAALDAVRQWKYEAGSKETVEMVDFVFESTK